MGCLTAFPVKVLACELSVIYQDARKTALCRYQGFASALAAVRLNSICARSEADLEGCHPHVMPTWDADMGAVTSYYRTG